MPFNLDHAVNHCRQRRHLDLELALHHLQVGGDLFAQQVDERLTVPERTPLNAKTVRTIQADTNEAVSSMEQTTSEVVSGARLVADAMDAAGTGLAESNTFSLPWICTACRG